MKLMLAVFGLATLSCSAPWRELRMVHVSPDFTNSETGEVIAGVETWFEDLPDRRVPVVISRRCKGGCIRPVDRGKACRGKRLARTKMGPFRAPRITICRRKVPRDELAWVVAHELGHALTLRLDHIEDGTVMADPIRYGEGDPQLSREDVEYVVGPSARDPREASL